jgi:hypothetical protein
MQTSKTLVRFDSRSSLSVSAGRPSRSMQPCTVTNEKGTTVVTESPSKLKKVVLY